MIKLQAKPGANSSAGLQLIIDTENKTYKTGYFLASFDVATIGTKKALSGIIDQLENNNFKKLEG